MFFIYPFMAAIQEISGRLGRITGRGIAGNIHRFYPRWALYSIVSLLLIANIINIGADIGAMGAAVNLLIGGPALVYCVIFAHLGTFGGFHPLQNILSGPQMAHAVSFCLRRYSLCHTHTLDGSSTRNLPSNPFVRS